MAPPGEARALRLVQRGDEERVAVELDRAYVAGEIAGGHAQRAAGESRRAGGVQPVAAVVALDSVIAAVHREQPRSRLEANRPRLLDEGAGQWRNHGIGGRRLELGVRRCGHAPHGAGVFEQRVLEAAAGAEERDVVLAGDADGLERPVGVGVGAGRHAPDAVEHLQVRRRVADERRAVDPRPVDRMPRRTRGQTEGERDGPMRDHGWIVVADQRDARRWARRVHAIAYSVISM